MILYTIVPENVIFGTSGSGSEIQLVEMEYLGEKVQVTPLSNNRFVINRLISTSPKAYLNPKLQPGTIIRGNFK